MARANSIFSLAPDAFTRQTKQDSVEKKLVITVLGLRNLTPNPNTSTQSCYVSLRAKERYQWLEPSSSIVRSSNNPASTFREGGGGGGGSQFLSFSPSSVQGLDQQLSSGSGVSAAEVLDTSGILAVLMLNDDGTAAGASRSSSIVDMGGPPNANMSSHTATGGGARPFTTASELGIDGEGGRSTGSSEPNSPMFRANPTGRSSTSGAATSANPEVHIDFLTEVSQSRTVSNSLNPKFGETFILRDLPIPLIRRSSIGVVDYSTASGKFDTSESFGGYSEDVAAKVAQRRSTIGSLGSSGGFAHPQGSPFFKRRKINQSFLLDIGVFDTSSSPGAGVRSGEVEIDLGELVEGKRVKLNLPLRVLNETPEETASRRKSYFAAPDSIFNADIDGEVSYEDQHTLVPENIVRPPECYLPTIELVLEPVNMGIQPKKNLGGVRAELMEVLQEELGSTFSPKLLAELHRLMLLNGASGPPSRPTTSDGQQERSVSSNDKEIEEVNSPLDPSVLNPPNPDDDAFFLRGLLRAEMHDFLQELYYYTGTPVPEDDDLKTDVDFLFAVFDRDRNALMDISEICVMLKASTFAMSLHPRWRRAVVPASPATTSIGTNGAISLPPAGGPAIVGGGPSVIASASIAGALWNSQPPNPFEYPGFRHVNGQVVDRTRRPPESALGKPMFVPRDEEAESRALLRRAEEALGVAPSPEQQDEEEKEGGGLGGSNNTQVSKNSVPTPHNNVGGSGLRKYSSTGLTGTDTVVRTRIFGQTIKDSVIQDAELASCTMTGCTLVHCKLVGGVVHGGFMESCHATSGCDLQQVLQLRTCLVQNCRVSNDTTITNCRINSSELVDVRYLMQCTLVDVSIIVTTNLLSGVGTRYTYTSMKECVFDGDRISDQGGNLLDGCKLNGQ